MSTYSKEAPSKSCSLDPLPSSVLKDILSEVMPFVAYMCNASLQDDRLPFIQRHAVVTHRLKKANADAADAKNYRLISNLTFISKVVETLVCHQLVAFLDTNGLLRKRQSAYRKHYSTETAVLKVISDALLAADRGEVTLLYLLDLSAAFDTVDHDILIDRLQAACGIQGTVLSWISSFLKDRTQTVTLAGSRSTTSNVKCGVPKGSFLGPVLFLLYTAEVTAIAYRHSVGAHSYADDTQLHIHRKAEDLGSSMPLVTCIDEINCWMSPIA